MSTELKKMRMKGKMEFFILNNPIHKVISREQLDALHRDGTMLLRFYVFRIELCDDDDMNWVCVSLEENFQTYQILS